MPPLIPTLVVFVAAVFASTAVYAEAGQTSSSPPPLKLASLSAGRITGVVKDDRGRGVPGVSVLALGDTLATARSDADGRFVMALPAGEYVLRATRDGYLSTYREPVRVRSSVRLERNITLVRLGPGAPPEPILAALAIERAAQPGGPGPELLPATHAHSETAWRLRRLTRTILRDEGVGTGVAAGDAAFREGAVSADGVIAGSARAAATFIADTNFSGQVNFLTTGLRDAGDGWRPDDWARGVAFLAVGAPFGSHGDWLVRGAMTPGDLSSWVLDGEYAARTDRDHAFRLGMSMGVQGDLTERGRRRATGTQTRSVAAVRAEDRWRVNRYLELDYGVRLDRYDYVDMPLQLGPSVGARLAVLAGTVVTASGSRRAVAPGANEFLPPPASGVWLPPERTFSTLDRQAPFRSERVRHLTIGVEQAIGPDGHTIFVRRFRQSTADQIATIFGIDRSRDVGHYYVASAGSAEIDGWQVGLSGGLTSRVWGTVEYSASRADWTPGPEGRAIGRAVPSLTRDSGERVHDLGLLVEADIPETATGVRFGYRLSSGFSRPRTVSPDPVTGARFDLEIRQALPYQPFRGGRLEALLAVRNLFSDPVAATSFYDELLTVAPPLRLVFGIQVRF